MDSLDERVSPTWIVLKMGAIVALMALFNFLPQVLGLISYHSLYGIRILPLSALGIHLPVEWLNVWWLVALALNWLLLKAGRWTRETRWVELGLGLFGAWILGSILARSWSALQVGAFLPQIGHSGLRRLAGLMVLSAVAVPLVVVLVRSLSRFSRLMPDGLPEAGRIAGTARERVKSLDGGRWWDYERALRRDLNDVYEFYLTPDERRRLTEMGRVGRSFRLVVWVLKSMYRKLTPARRILLLAALLAPTIRVQTGNSWVDFRILSVGILIVILLLELKDKLIAHDELAVGRAVQIALLPGRSPQVPGWDIWLYTQPANEVGGDLVDYLNMGDDRWGVALGAVAGKGLGAALLMAKLQATLRALAPGFDCLGDLGIRLNEIIYRDGLRNSFASLLYLELGPSSGRLRLLNAGHLPPVVLGPSTIEETPRGAPALGILPRWSYEERVLHLEPGETLLVYSDGLTEAVNEKGEYFGDEPLQALLKKLGPFTAEAMGARLLTEVKTFLGEGRPTDDLSLAVLKRLG